MTSLADRQSILEAIEQAVQAGARIEKAGVLIGISPRTLKRWKPDRQTLSDQRPEAKRPMPGYALSEDEKQPLLSLCNQAEYAHLPPFSERSPLGRPRDLPGFGIWFLPRLA